MLPGRAQGPRLPGRPAASHTPPCAALEAFLLGLGSRLGLHQVTGLGYVSIGALAVS